MVLIIGGVWDLNTVSAGYWERYLYISIYIYIFIYTNTHICTQDTLNKVRAVHIMIDSVSQSRGPCQPSEVVLAANALKKKKKRQDYESCIELLRNVNNAKSKPVHYTD